MGLYGVVNQLAAYEALEKTIVYTDNIPGLTETMISFGLAKINILIPLTPGHFMVEVGLTEKGREALTKLRAEYQIGDES